MAQPISSQQRGVTLIAVMASIVVITLICGVLLKIALAEHRQGRMAAYRVQAQWLAESGVERAAAQLDRSAEYAGETWHIAEPEWNSGSAGVVVIEVKSLGDGRTVHVRADYLRNGQRHARVTKQFQWKVSKQFSESAS